MLNRAYLKFYFTATWYIYNMLTELHTAQIMIRGAVIVWACSLSVSDLMGGRCSTEMGKTITKTCLYHFDPLKPHFHIVKLGFTGVYIIFLISAQKHRLWVLVRTASPSFLSENFHFLEVKFSIYLNRHVFVMDITKKKYVDNYTEMYSFT